MAKVDITKNQLFINSFEYVMRSVLHKNKKLKTDGRHSDAFVYITEGSCTYVFDDGYTFTVKEGDIIYLAHNSVYTMQLHTENYYAIFTNFTFDCNENRKSEIYTPTDANAAEVLFKKLYRTYCADSQNVCDCISIIYKIYAMLKSIENNKETAESELIKSVKNEIDNNFSDFDLSVASLAEKAGISEVHLRKLFKKHYLVSPSQYITSVRVKSAISLMQYPNFSLNDCATQSGFSSLQYFCRVFKKQMGISPAKYKNERFF